MNKELGRVVVLLAHPDMQGSRANKALYETVKDIEGVTVYNLYENPQEVFNIEDWSRILSNSAALVLQFPFHWSSAPAMMKRWLDEVFTHLSQTPSIAGKPLLVVTTTGSEFESYRSGGRNQFTVDELLRPYQVAAIHSGMAWQTPLVVYGTAVEDPARKIAEGANHYKEWIDALLKNNNMAQMSNW